MKTPLYQKISFITHKTAVAANRLNIKLYRHITMLSLIHIFAGIVSYEHLLCIVINSICYNAIRHIIHEMYGFLNLIY